MVSSGKVSCCYACRACRVSVCVDACTKRFVLTTRGHRAMETMATYVCLLLTGGFHSRPTMLALIPRLTPLPCNHARTIIPAYAL